MSKNVERLITEITLIISELGHTVNCFVLDTYKIWLSSAVTNINSPSSF